MKRKVYLKGSIADKFGEEFEIEAVRPTDIFQCLNANFPDFKQYLINAYEDSVGFLFEIADKGIEKEEDLLLPMKEGDVVIAAIPSGSSGGGGKILAAAAIIGFIAITGGFGTFAIGAGGGGTIGTGYAMAVGGGLNLLGQLAVGLAINLALTGIQQLMAPDPSVDESEDSYLFNGSEQNIVEGDPVPVLYGQLRVPGQPISFEVLNREFRGANDNSSIYPIDYTGVAGYNPLYSRINLV